MKHMAQFYSHRFAEHDSMIAGSHEIQFMTMPLKCY